MVDFAGAHQLPPLFAHTAHTFCGGREIRDNCANIFAASNAVGTANSSLYTPVHMPWVYPVRRVFWMNGATVAGNCDFGIYTPDGAKIYSTGTTAMSGASAPQFVTVGTPFSLTPGLYYFGFATDSATASFGGYSTTTGRSKMAGILQQATYPLPATATFATNTLLFSITCGVTQTSSGY